MKWRGAVAGGGPRRQMARGGIVLVVVGVGHLRANNQVRGGGGLEDGDALRQEGGLLEMTMSFVVNFLIGFRNSLNVRVLGG